MAGKVVKVSVRADTKQFSRAFKGLAAETGLTKLAAAGRFIGDALKTGAIAGAAGLGALALKAKNAAADLEQSAGAVQEVFKGSAGQMEKWAAGAASAVGLSKNQYNEFATLLGSQLKNAGISMEALGPKTNQLISQGADMAAMFGGTTSEAVGALSSALKGERDPIERYGVTLTAASIDAKAAAMGFQKVGGAFDQEAKAAATMELILEQTRDSHGKFGRESATWSHQVQVFKSHFENFAAFLGSHFLPQLTKLLAWVNANFEPTWRKAATVFKTDLIPAFNRAKPTLISLGNTIKSVAIWIATSLVPALGRAVMWVWRWRGPLAAVVGPILAIVGAWKAWQKALRIAQAAQLAYKATLTTVKAAQQAYLWGTYGMIKGNKTFTTTVAGLTGALRTKTAALRASIAAAGRWVASTVAATAAAIRQRAATIASAVAEKAGAAARAIATGAQWLLNAALTANPIGLIIAAIAALIAIFVGLYKNNETVRKAVDAAWAGIKKAMAAVVEWVKNVAVPWLQQAWEKVKAGAAQLAAWLAPIWNTIKATITTVWGFISQYVQTAITVIQKIIQAVMAAINGDWGAAWGYLKQAAAAVWGFIRSIISSAITGIWAVITSILGAIKGIWGSVWGWIKGLASSVWSSIVQSISTGVGRAVSAVAALPGKVKAGLGNLGSLLYQAGRDLLQGMINGVAAMAQALVDRARKVVGDAIQAAKNLLGIASPSRVFFEIGVNTGLGLINGLDAMGARAAAAAARLTGEVATTPAPIIGASYTPSTAPAAGSVTYNIRVEMSTLTPTVEAGREIARAIETYIRSNGRTRPGWEVTA